MADVRSLLREQRVSRRIEHPFAAYSEAGKLVCTLCREAIKSEALWDGHLRGAGHRRRLQSQAQAASQGNGNGDAAPSNKRKHDESDDEELGEPEAVRRKRSKNDMAPGANFGEITERERENGRNLTPPSLTSRTSTTPGQGMEIQIPSRPATPAPPRDGTSASSTPNIVTPLMPSPLIPQEAAAVASAGPIPPRQQSSLANAQTADGAGVDVDEDEWAAFEADIAATAAPYAPDAVISAPAMSAEEAAAAAEREDEERKRRRAATDSRLADEREEATRALENEFEDMEELEARVRRLKEKREALRLQSGVAGDSSAAKPTDFGKENARAGDANGGLESDVEDEYEDEDEDEWAGFRFRG
jgi:zinc finger protein 830